MRVHRLIVFIACIAVANVAAQEEEAAAVLTKERVEALLAEARGVIAALPADAASGSPEAARKEALSAKVVLLEEWLQIESAAAARGAVRAGLEARSTQAKTRLAELEALPPATAPEQPAKEGFARLEDEITRQRDQVAASREKVREAQQLLETGPQKVAAARERSTAAARRATALGAEAAKATDDAARAWAELRRENARIEEAVAARQAADLEAQAEHMRAVSPVRRAELALQEAQLTRLEAEYAAYGAALKERLERERKESDEEVARKERAAEGVERLPERLLARWEAAVARSRLKSSDVEGLLIVLKKELSEQQKRLETARDELAALEDYLARSGTSARAAERLKKALNSLPNRRSALERAADTEHVMTLDTLRERRFEIEDTLFTLNESRQEDLEAALATLPEDQRPAFRQKSAALRNSYYDALQDEMAALTEAISLGQRIQSVQLERLANLDEFERFIRARVFWVQDDLPLGAQAFAPLGNELKGLAEWSRRLVARDTVASLRAAAVGVRGVLFGLLLFPVLPFTLLLVRRRLRRFVERRHEHARAGRASFWDGLLATFGIVVAAALFPAYLWFAAHLAAAAALPPDIGPVLEEVLRHLAIFFLGWLLARALFRPGGMAEVQFGLDGRAAGTIFRSLRILLLGYVSLLLLWRIWSAPPFGFEALPRLAYTLFGLAALSALFVLVRANSGFVRHALARHKTNPISRHWSAISALILLLAFASIVLDTLGYRYGARSLAESVAFSLVTLLVLWPLHDATAAGVESILRRRHRGDVTAAPGKEAVPREMIEAQTKSFVRALFVILGVVAIARSWGLDEQAFRTLDEVRIHTISPTEYVSVADLLLAMLYMVATVWLLRNLPGIYEIAVFPRFDLDSGLRYAIVTISRYALFFVGLVLALGTIHLDLSRMGWLVAAMGVGLGFGLQDIVSNFVSGIIILVERPIRVGDTVTIGAKSGKVLRINIRSTTLLDFNRQEIVVPNRSLITQDVTNWTGADTIIRLQVPIGVAYGSDVDRVTDILMGIAVDEPAVLKEPAPSVVFLKHGESSLDFELRVFLPDPGVKMTVLDHINKEISRRLAAAKIEIPYPQRELHIRSSVVDLGEAAGGGGGRGAREREAVSKRS